MPITRDHAASVVKRAGCDNVGKLLCLLDKSPTLEAELMASSSLDPDDADETIIAYLCAAAAEGAGVGQAAPGIGAAEGEIVQLLRVIASNSRRALTGKFSRRHRYTTSQATQVQDPNFKSSLVQAYQCQDLQGPGPSAHPHGQRLRCMLSDQLFPSSLVRGPHLFKRGWHRDGYAALGFHNINDVRNGLLLVKPFQEAFDNGYLVFIKSGEEFIAHWLGDDRTQVADPGGFPWRPDDELPETAAWAEIQRAFQSQTFKSVVEGRPLMFSTDARPYRRCLSYQARRAIDAAKQLGLIDDTWLVGKALDFHNPEAGMIEGYFTSIPAGGADIPPRDLDSEQS